MNRPPPGWPPEMTGPDISWFVEPPDIPSDYFGEGGLSLDELELNTIRTRVIWRPNKAQLECIQRALATLQHANVGDQEWTLVLPASWLGMSDFRAATEQPYIEGPKLYGHPTMWCESVNVPYMTPKWDRKEMMKNTI